MKRIILGLLVFVLMAGVLAADVVHLKDGRTFEGKVTIVGNHVQVSTKFGPVTVPRSSVKRIEKKESSADVYVEKAGKIAAADVEGHYKLGLWCKKKQLSRQAISEFEKVIVLNPEHKGARSALGFVKIDDTWQKAPHGKIYAGEGEWLTPAEAVENARAQYKLEQYGKARKLLEEALRVGLPADKRVEATIQLGKTHERQSGWKEACAAFDKALRMKLTPSQKSHLKCRRGIIKEAKGGMYLISGPAGQEDIFSIDSKAPDAPKEVLKGLQSLSKAGVMYVAVRDKASARALKGKERLEKAKKALDGTDGGCRAAMRLLDKADVEFEAANLIVKDIARGLQIESVKQRVGILDKKVGQKITAFQGQWMGAMMGASAAKLKRQLPGMYAMLSEMEKDLEDLDKVARRFPDELADQVAKVRHYRNQMASIKAYIRNLNEAL